MNWNAPEIIMASIGGFFAVYSLIVTTLYVSSKKQIKIYEEAAFIRRSKGKKEAFQKQGNYILTDEFIMLQKFRKLSEVEQEEIRKRLK